ncbi:ABC transporter permease [Methylobacterium indicum]|uniref:Putative ABC transporter permease protein y4mJ n=1 Tax=Methylobacterium indicum TaxID=1775910 RepID=A0A8H8WYJ6_9HYPH|nr:ABC transporter permease [Methylobacterium indicum]BCM86888.1 putative ABC transporter permease protein y4mJ [Methylobacterium indicum]
MTDILAGAPPHAGPARPRRAGSGARLLRTYRTEIAIAAAIVLIELAVSLWSPQVLSLGNIANIAQASAPLILVSLGVFLVIATSGIDLSVGSTFSLTGMVAGLGLSAGLSWPVACLASLGVGAGIGAINGALVTFVGLAPFVVTLVTFAVGGSLAFVVTDGHSIAILDPDFWWLNAGTLVPGIANYVLFCLVGVALLEFALRKLVLGRWVYAIGSNAKAARLLGIPVDAVRCGVYVASGLCASFASLLSLSYISNSEATSGANLMLQAIAACVIGGASLFGGTGSAIGAMLGAVMITVIQNGVNLIGINSFWQGSVTGLVILVAVLIDRFTKARA